MMYWSPNISYQRGTLQPSSMMRASFRKRWKDLEDIKRRRSPGKSHFSPVRTEDYSSFLESPAASILNQFDASCYSSGTISSGVSSMNETGTDRSRSRSRSDRDRSRSKRLSRTEVASRNRSPSVEMIRKAVYNRGKSVDNSLLATSKLTLVTEKSTVSPSKRILRKKKKLRQIKSYETQIDLSKLLPQERESGESSDKSEAFDRSESPAKDGEFVRSTRMSRKDLFVKGFDSAVARAKSLGRYSKPQGGGGMSHGAVRNPRVSSETFARFRKPSLTSVSRIRRDCNNLIRYEGLKYNQ